MKLITEITIKQEADITYESRVMMFGSCFSENIGNRLDQLKFNVSNNPLGILFNPCSIKESIRRIAEKRRFVSDDLFCRDGVWNSFHLHSKFAQLNEEAFLQNANRQVEAAHLFLQNATHIFITLGTAWIYELSNTRQIVANCHKEPQEMFIRRRIGIEECSQALRDTVAAIRQVNPNASIIFTVSPIRHWKDGAHDNQISKSTLLLATEKIREEEPSVHYFPAYEIMMDELRDYRFYAEDMIHPNDLAIQYIWEKFTSYGFSEETLNTLSRIEKIIAAVHHRPFNPQSEGHRKFQERILAEMEELHQTHPFLNFQKEKEQLMHPTSA